MPIDFYYILLPAILTLKLRQMAIGDACPVERAICVYWLAKYTAGSGSNKGIPYALPSTLHACQESRYEMQTTKFIQWDIDQATGAWLNPRRPFCPKLDMLYVPFHLFAVVDKKDNNNPSFIQRNPAKLPDYCKQHLAIGNYCCSHCRRIYPQLLLNLVGDLKLLMRGNGVEPPLLQRSISSSRASWGTWGRPTFGDLGVCVKEVDGMYLLKAVRLGRGTDMWKEIETPTVTIPKDGDSCDFQFVMPADFDMTIFPKRWPNN